LFKLFIKFFLVYFIFFSNTNSSEFYNLPDFFDNKNIKINEKIVNKDVLKININFKNPKKIARDLIGNMHQRISNKKKTKVRSHVEITYKDNSRCIFNATINLHGSSNSHRKLIGQNYNSSFNLKLLNGGINYVNEFKLLLPDTRNNKNEIFVTAFFSEIGFLSPKTYKIKVNHNFSKEYDVLLQEHINDTFQIKNNLVSGTILSFNKRELVKNIKNYNKISSENKKKEIKKLNHKIFSRLYDSGSVNLKDPDNPQNMLHILNGMERLNKIKLEHYKFPYLLIDNQNYFLSNKEFEMNSIFEIFMISTNSSHGLALEDRRFYLDKYNNNLKPIYYDGKSTILDNSLQKTKIHQLIKTNHIKSVEKAKSMLDTIDKTKFIKKLKLLDSTFTIEEVNFAINNIKKNLNKIYNHRIKLQAKEKSYDKSFSKEYSYLVGGLKNNFEICDYNFKCEKIILKQNELISIIKNQGIKLNKVSPKKIKYFKLKNINKENKYNKFNSFKVNNNFIIKHNESIKINMINDNEIHIFQKFSDGKIFIENAHMDNFKIYFHGTEIKNKKNITNYITEGFKKSCVTIYNTIFKTSEINFSNNTYLNCYDTLSIINSSGNIKSLNLNLLKNNEDALDIENSNINIENLNISNSNYECLDVKNSRLNIKNINFFNCKRNNIKIENLSLVEIDSIETYKNKNFISIGDSSDLIIKKVIFDQFEKCIYTNTEREIYGDSKIQIPFINCKEKIIKKDNSKIIYN